MRAGAFTYKRRGTPKGYLAFGPLRTHTRAVENLPDIESEDLGGHQSRSYTMKTPLLASIASILAIAASGDWFKAEPVQEFPPEQVLPLDDRGSDPGSFFPPFGAEPLGVGHRRDRPVILGE